MTDRQMQEGLANMARLDVIVQLAESGSPKLKRRGEELKWIDWTID